MIDSLKCKVGSLHFSNFSINYKQKNPEFPGFFVETISKSVFKLLQGIRRAD